MRAQIDSIERLLSILDTQETLIKAQKDHIYALQTKLKKVVLGQQPLSDHSTRAAALESECWEP
jgi:hypothetical protein